MDWLALIQLLAPYIRECLEAKKTTAEVAAELKNPRLFQRRRMDRSMRLAEGLSPREWRAIRTERWQELNEAQHDATQKDLEELVEEHQE